jgi:hypothetical protein
MMSRTMICLSIKRERRSEEGAALLIAIFALLLISVVGIALIVSTGTDSALTGNYRTSAGAYYAAVAGLEEARGRLLWKNPNYINNTNSYSTLLSPTGLPTWGLTQVLYIVNPADGEAASSVLTDYPDTEYQTEFGWPLSGAVVNQITSVSPDTASTPSLLGQQFRWVRVTPATELSLGIDVDADGNQDPSTVLYYDPGRLDASGNFSPGLIAPAVPPPAGSTAVQVLEITSLSVLPSGSRRMLQYVVAPLMITPNTSVNSVPTSNMFPAALTLAGNPSGNPVSFTVPTPATGPGPHPPNIFQVNGQDSCAGNVVYSIGYTQSSDGPAIAAAAMPLSNFTGAPAPATNPGIGNINSTPSTALIRPNWLTLAGLDSLVQDITKSADIVFNGSISANTSLTPLGMSVSKPLTIVVNGDLDFNGWHQTGYGLLLVTGTLKYDPDAIWFGPILIIGQGSFVSTRGGSGQINGPVFIAKTRDTSGNLLSVLGAASFSQTGSATDSGKGIYYNSCAANAPSVAGPGSPGPGAQGPLTYKVLSFREIPLAN